MKHYSIIIASISLFLLAGTCERAGKADREVRIYKDSAVVEYFRRTSGWIAGDGAFSIPLSDGRTLWVMGDSHINDFNPETGTIPCLFNVHNAGLLQAAGDWSHEGTQTLVGTEKGRESFFTDTAGHERWYWPVAGIQLKDTVYIYFTGVERASGGLGFAVSGKDKLVKLKFPEMELVGYNSLPDFGGINFGVGFIPDEESGYVYAYGHRYSQERAQNDMYVSRFPASNPAARWEVWDGQAWSGNYRDARVILEDANSTPMVCRVRDRFLLVNSEFSVGCDQGNRIFISVAENPTGPFSSPRPLHTIDDTLQGHYPFFYVPVAHPQFINEQDELLITYNVNGYGTCLEGCKENRMDPDHYRPRGIRVPLKLIHPDL